MEFTVSFYAADLGMTVHNSTYSGLLPGRPKPVKAVPVAMVKTVTDPTGPAGQLAVGDIILKINNNPCPGAEAIGRESRRPLQLHFFRPGKVFKSDFRNSSNTELLRRISQLAQEVAKLYADVQQTRQEQERLAPEKLRLHEQLANSEAEIAQRTAESRQLMPEAVRLREVRAQLQQAQQAKIQLEGELADLEKICKPKSLAYDMVKYACKGIQVTIDEAQSARSVQATPAATNGMEPSTPVLDAAATPAAVPTPFALTPAQSTETKEAEPPSVPPVWTKRHTQTWPILQKWRAQVKEEYDSQPARPSGTPIGKPPKKVDAVVAQCEKLLEGLRATGDKDVVTQGMLLVMQLLLQNVQLRQRMAVMVG